MKKLCLSLLISLFSLATANADLAERIESIINQPSQKKTQFAIHVINADTGKSVYRYNAQKPMIPASNMKIITSAAALKFLRSNYEYKTQVGLCGNSLVIIGSGDPLLSDYKIDAKYNRKTGWILDDITQKLQKLGISKIDDIIVDTTVFDDQRVHPNWPRDDLNKWWASEVCGLNYNGNCIAMTVTNKGGRAVVSIEPVNSYVNIINQTKIITSGSGAVGAYRQLGKENHVIVKGKCRKKQGPFDVAIERPAGFFGQLLAERFAAANISTKGHLIEKAVDPDCKFKKIAEYKNTIEDCLVRCNKDSFGLVAEALLKTISAQNKTGKLGSWQGGQKLCSEYLLSLGLGAEEFNIDDASGLSRENKLSPNTLTTVLYDVYKGKNWPLFKKSLAVGGVDGTIYKYFKEEKYRGNIIGKTGYISSVKSFSGFCFTEKGTFIFSVITEDANGKTRDAINQIAEAIFD